MEDVIYFVITMIVGGTTLWAGLDASRLMRGIPRKKRVEIGGRTLGAPRSPAGWVVACMLLWIVAFPWYLAKRRRYLAFHQQKFMEEYERQKAEGVEAVPPPAAEALKQVGFPFMTSMLLGINLLFWLIMEAAGGSTEIPVLLRFGAQENGLVVAGQYWRLFTSMFLHIGFEHFLFNCLALLLFGRIVESLYGRRRFLALYLISGYFGNILFLAFGPTIIVSAGASGAIFGILGAHIPLGKRLHEGGRVGMRPRGLAGVGYVIWAFVRSMGLGVNILAHFGGVVAGIVLGYALYPVTLRFEDKERIEATEVRKNWGFRGAVIGAILLALTAAATYTSSAWKSRAIGGWDFSRSPNRPESPGKEPRVMLRQKYLPGRYEKVGAEVEDTVMRTRGQTEREHSSETTWWEMSASELDALGRTTCVVTIKRLKESGSDGSYDTDDPASLRRNEAAQMFSQIMLNREFVLKFGPDGEFISASGFDEMWDEMADEAAREGRMAVQVVRQMKEQMGDEALTELFNLASDELPDEPVGVGAVWHKSKSMKVPFVGTVKCDAECELTKMEQTPNGNIAHIAFTSYMESRKRSTTKMGPLTMTVRKLNLRQKGETQLNADTGLIIKRKEKTDGRMGLSMKAPGRKKVSGEITFNTREETTTRRIADEPEIEQIVASQRQDARQPPAPMLERARAFLQNLTPQQRKQLGIGEETDLESMTPEQFRELFRKIVQRRREPRPGGEGMREELREEVQEVVYPPARVTRTRLLAGRVPPGFSLRDLDGETIRFSDSRDKAVMVNFWATWVPSCMREMAALEELARAQPDNLVVLGICVDSEGENTVKACVEKRKITYPVIMSTREILDAFESATGEPIGTIPTTIIIGKGGLIKEKRAGAQSRGAFQRAFESATALRL